jgi:mannose-6-phosphate isomerase-like protein (cupin superfamily)
VEGEVPAAVRPLDVVYIPAGASQRITNTGIADLTFLCVCTPRFKPAVYEDRES